MICVRRYAYILVDIQKHFYFIREYHGCSKLAYWALKTMINTKQKHSELVLNSVGAGFEPGIHRGERREKTLDQPYSQFGKKIQYSELASWTSHIYVFV